MYLEKGVNSKCIDSLGIHHMVSPMVRLKSVGLSFAYSSFLFTASGYAIGLNNSFTFLFTTSGHAIGLNNNSHSNRSVPNLLRFI